MQTKDLANENYEKLKALFPNAITETMDAEGNIVRAIDKDILMQEISAEVVEGREERYQFTWPDKRQAIANANAPIAKTLRPCREESVNFDETENLYIEGDNLEVLKLLQETYLGKIKMIYIDPPYNTGNDFVYNDNFSMDRDEYLEDSGQFDEEGNRLEKNLESNGRFHTDWLNMMYPRLKLARNLLSDDGVIFISIDDNEQENLKKVCNEIFGEGNFIACLKWKKKKQPSFLSKVADVIEYILVFSKNKNNINKLSVEKLSDGNKPVVNASNNLSKISFRKGVIVKADTDFIKAGKYKNKTMETEYLQDVYIKNGRTTNDFEVISKFRTSQKEFDKFLKQDLIFITKNLGIRRNLTLEEKQKRKSITDLLLDWGQNQDATKETKELFELEGDYNIFDNPKPSLLIKNLIYSTGYENDIILDFFSGSSTTAHATMQLNAEDGGNRKFIMVQLPEETDEKSAAYKAGFKNICEIGKERIRRAGKKIIEENQNKEDIENLDTGFRVLKVDSSNMKDVYYAPAQTEQSLLDMFSDNIKEDRTSEDLLFQVMLELGISLSSKIERELVDEKEVFIVEDGFLIACFDKNITEKTVKAIAEKEPDYAVFRDSSMANDSVATNFEQIFENMSPQTVRKVV